MRTDKVGLNAADLSDEMVVMRGWLDRNRYEATRFDCDQDGDVVVLSIDFTVEAIASDFARRFDGYSVHHRRGRQHRDSSHSPAKQATSATTAKMRASPSSQCASPPRGSGCLRKRGGRR